MGLRSQWTADRLSRGAGQRRRLFAAPLAGLYHMDGRHTDAMGHDLQPLGEGLYGCVAASRVRGGEEMLGLSMKAQPGWPRQVRLERRSTQKTTRQKLQLPTAEEAIPEQEGQAKRRRRKSSEPWQHLVLRHAMMMDGHLIRVDWQHTHTACMQKRSLPTRILFCSPLF